MDKGKTIMGIEVNIEPEQINKYISDKIIESAIGEQVKKVVTEQCAKMSESYRNPIEAAIKEVTTTIIHQVILSEFKDQIKSKIKAKIDERLDIIVTDAVMAMNFRDR